MTAEEFLNNKGKTQFGTFGDSYPKLLVEKYLIEFAQFHVKQALLEASNKARLSGDWGDECVVLNRVNTRDADGDWLSIGVNDNSILNAYPDDRIK